LKTALAIATLIAMPALADEIDHPALDAVVKQAEASGSHALVVYHDGKLVGEWYFGKPVGPIESMSATKSIVSLAIGILVDEGKIKSVDQPVADFFPEWKQGRKKTITLRHLLSHTSGLQAEPNTVDIYPAPDFVQLALAAELSNDPGTKFFYNNKAVNLLAGIVQRASGKRMDKLLDEKLFKPLGITDYQWSLDRAGNPHGMSGLHIRPLDLAKIGVALADGKIVSETWRKEMTTPGLNQWCGLLWWLQGDPKLTIDDSVIAEWRKAGQSEEFIKRVLPLKDRVLTREPFFVELGKIFNGPRGLDEWYDATWKRGLPDGKIVDVNVIGYNANGSAGQYLVVFPKQKLVAVRMRRVSDDPKDQADHDKEMGNFPKLVRKLIKL
jgi:CubicO group peptidase (beta-lactamase class C family)